MYLGLPESLTALTVLTEEELNDHSAHADREEAAGFGNAGA